MRWSRLKNYKCPKCNADLAKRSETMLHKCSNAQCDFSITEERMQELVSDLYKPRKHQSGEDENFAALQSL